MNLHENIVNKKILVVAPFIPSRMGNTAGQRLLWHNIVALSTRNKVFLFCMDGNNARAIVVEELGSYCEFIEVFNFGKFRKALAVSMGIFRGMGPIFSARYCRAAQEKILKLINMHECDHIHFEFGQSMSYIGCLDLIKRKITTSACFHDVVIQHALRSGIFFKYITAKWTFDYESKLASIFDTIYVLSEKDAALISCLYGAQSNKISVIDLRVNPAVSKYSWEKSQAEPHSILFFGAMSRRENELACLDFIRLCWGRVITEHPDAKFYIVGSSPTNSVLRLNGKTGIFVTGFVDSPQEFISKASVAIVPLTEGAGVKFKTLELLSSGIPVLSTPVGAEGVDRANNLKVIELGNFTESILELMRD